MQTILHVEMSTKPIDVNKNEKIIFVIAKLKSGWSVSQATVCIHKPLFRLTEAGFIVYFLRIAHLTIVHKGEKLRTLAQNQQQQLTF